MQQHKKIISRIVSRIVVVTMIASTLVGCATKESEPTRFGRIALNSIEMESMEYFLDKNGMSIQSSSPENSEWLNYSSLNAMLLELNAGKIDVMVAIPKCTADYIAKTDSSLLRVDNNPFYDFVMGTRHDEKELVSELNSAIDTLKANGELDKIIKEYITDIAGDPVPNKIAGSPSGKTYVVGITGDFPPMDYVTSDGIPAGFNVALLNAIAQLNGCNFEIVQVESSARTTALASGKIDVIFWNYCVMRDEFEIKNNDIAVTQSYYFSPETYITKDPALIEVIKKMIYPNKG